MNFIKCARAQDFTRLNLTIPLICTKNTFEVESLPGKSELHEL